VGRVTDQHSSTYAGARLGLPPHGPGSVAGWGRRIAALFVDWTASTLVAVPVFGYVWLGETAGQQGWVGASPVLVFLLEATLLTALVGGSFGQLALRVVVIRLGGGPVSVLRALLRTSLICLVIPPLVYTSDRRGLHDLAAGTVAVNR
jgi:uncharacterized RDD family membrane protein YckC